MTREHMGLCLTGGGITGAMYEVGVLAALEDSLEDFKTADFDVFIGVSSGATLAATLAAGHSAQRLYRALLDPADDFFPLQRQHLLRIDSQEMRRVWDAATGTVRRLIGSVLSKNPLQVDLWEELDRFYDSLPAGLFSMETYEQFLNDVFRRRNIPSSFRDYKKPLLIVTNDLDAGERVVCGTGYLEDVSVERAIAASSAEPLLFAPIRIGELDCIAGNTGEYGHADLAADFGCDTVFVINPLVPIYNDRTTRSVPTGHGTMKRLRSKGLLWVYSQSWRLVTEARLRRGLEDYRVAHPDVRVHLVEPERDDATMFMHSPMNFAARRAILEDGYTTTIKALRNPEHPLRKAFEDCGLVVKEA